MLVKPITYTDYNGVERTETFYFNLSQAELIDMQLGGKDGLYSDKLQKMIDNHDAAAIVGTIKEFVLKPLCDVHKLQQALSDKGFFAALETEEGYVSFCVTEKRTRKEIDALVKVVEAL